MLNSFHQKDLKYNREEPESSYDSKEGYCFDDNQLLRLVFEQLKNERYIAEAGVSATGEVNDMLLKQVFQQRKKLVLRC
jgi:hypothetical protein